MWMIRPTCATCGKELTCIENEVPVVHFLNNNKADGIDAMRYGDVWGCPTCNCRVVIGMGAMIHGYDISNGMKNHILDGKYIEIKRW